MALFSPAIVCAFDGWRDQIKLAEFKQKITRTSHNSPTFAVSMGVWEREWPKSGFYEGGSRGCWWSGSCLYIYILIHQRFVCEEGNTLKASNRFKQESYRSEDSRRGNLERAISRDKVCNRAKNLFRLFGFITNKGDSSGEWVVVP